jgi:hypothetical protein
MTRENFTERSPNLPYVSVRTFRVIRLTVTARTGPLRRLHPVSASLSVSMSARPRRPAGRFLAPNGRTRTKPLREIVTEGEYTYDQQHALDVTRDEDRRREVEQVREARSIRDEPECVGPSILTSYADVNRRLMTQHVIHEVAEAQKQRHEYSPQNRLETVRQRAKHAHVDMSHPIHLVQKAIDKARLRGQPIAPAAVVRLEGLEALLDGVSIQRLAA